VGPGALEGGLFLGPILLKLLHPISRPGEFVLQVLQCSSLPLDLLVESLSSLPQIFQGLKNAGSFLFHGAEVILDAKPLKLSLCQLLSFLENSQVALRIRPTGFASESCNLSLFQALLGHQNLVLLGLLVLVNQGELLVELTEFLGLIELDL
jgi:hypothetical protein